MAVGRWGPPVEPSKRSARMRTDSDRNLSAEADPNPARKTRERVLTMDSIQGWSEQNS